MRACLGYIPCCKSCGTTIEAIQKFDDRPLRKCRECTGRLEKLISRTSFQLKGGGWFAEGYGSGSKPKKSGASTPSKPASESKPSDKKASA